MSVRQKLQFQGLFVGHTVANYFWGLSVISNLGRQGAWEEHREISASFQKKFMNTLTLPNVALVEFKAFT